MASVVVLGMHGAGTSLVAGMLDAAGVAMNPNPRGYIHRKKYRTYEDSAFVRLNAAILHTAGGSWKRAPDPERLATTSDSLMGRMRTLIAARESECMLWGFKDPRTALTVHLYHPELPEPRYVVVEREPEEIANSLATRSTKAGDMEDWLPLVEIYHERIRQFVECHEPTVLHVDYDSLVDDDAEIRGLIEFVGIEIEAAVEWAAKVVKKDE